MRESKRSSGSVTARRRAKAAEEIVVQRDDAVAVIRFNRPARRNAFNESLMRDLAATLDDLGRAWPAVRVVVFAGQGQSFGAGGDLEMLMRPKTPAEVYDLRGSLARIYDLIQKGPQVAIAAIHGHCVGSALVLAACCDFRICAENARFLLPEINSGMLPGIGIARVSHVISDRMLRQLVIAGREYSAAEAHADGFATEIVPAGGEMGAALELALRIAAKAPDALLHARRVCSQPRQGDYSAAVSYELLANDALLGSADVRDRLRSFVERRSGGRKR